MITSIEIHNFKGIKDLHLSTTSLNLFMGVNGMGKSTVIQSILLIRQNIKNYWRQLSLNGELVTIGRGKDALYYFADSQYIEFNFEFRNPFNNIEVTLDTKYYYEANSDVLRASVPVHIDRIKAYREPLFNNHFVFLNAERIAPSVAYDMSYDRVFNTHDLGIHGEFAVHFLALNGDKITVPEHMRLASAPTAKLSDQVQAWMNVISPGVVIKTNEISQIDKVLITYGVQSDSIATDGFRPTNVGFGISYILPVLVACLSGTYKLIIIENPEAHLHPKGQSKMGELLARCAHGDTQLFIETHSDHIVNGLRVAVKEDLISPEAVGINYFSKEVKEGQNYIVNTPIRIAKNGELSDYPEDFMDEWENQIMKLFQ